MFQDLNVLEIKASDLEVSRQVKQEGEGCVVDMDIQSRAFLDRKQVQRLEEQGDARRRPTPSPGRGF